MNAFLLRTRLEFATRYSGWLALSLMLGLAFGLATAWASGPAGG